MTDFYEKVKARYEEVKRPKLSKWKITLSIACPIIPLAYLVYAIVKKILLFIADIKLLRAAQSSAPKIQQGLKNGRATIRFREELPNILLPLLAKIRLMEGILRSADPHHIPW